MTDTVRLAVGPMVLADWRTRALAITAEADAPNPWAKYLDATGVGYADLTLDELDEVIAQALDVVDEDGDPGRRAAYERVLRKATRARVDLARPALTAVELAEAIDSTTKGTAAPAGDNRVTVWVALMGARTDVVITPGRLAWGPDLEHSVPLTTDTTPEAAAAALYTALTGG